MYPIICIHFSVERYLGSFQLLVIINMAAMNIVEHVSLFHVGASSGYMPRSSIAGSSGSTMSNFLRDLQTDFQSDCTSLQSHQQWRSVPLPPHPCQHLLSPEFFFSFLFFSFLFFSSLLFSSLFFSFLSFFFFKEIYLLMYTTFCLHI